MGQKESTEKDVNKVEKKISGSSLVRQSDGKLEKKLRTSSADKTPSGLSNEPNLRRSNPGSSSGSTTLSSSGSSLNLSSSSNPPSKKESMLKISEGDIEKLQFVDFHDLQLIKILGEGSYGLVYLARWRNFNVAYKQLKNIDLDKIDEMTREAKIMFSMPSHPNVLQLFAIVLDGGNPLGMITEYLELGSLKDLLCGKQVKLTFQEIVKIAKDIAKGMKHLQDNRIVHRDLSARNILVSEEKGTWLCKVADFGLSRSLDQQQSKGQTKSNVGPLKWMAPESLIQKQYSFKSDVWSYAATLIEVLDKGNDPYPNLDGVQAASFVMHKDARPAVPENTPAKLEELLNLCFSRFPDKRPDFASILKVLDEVQEDIESNPFYAF